MRDLWRFAQYLSHYCVGVILALIWLIPWGGFVTMAGAYFFIKYELSEEKKKHDIAYKDIRQCNVAFFATLAVILIWKGVQLL